jgi:hypothetical protein
MPESFKDDRTFRRDAVEDPEVEGVANEEEAKKESSNRSCSLGRFCGCSTFRLLAASIPQTVVGFGELSLLRRGN